MINFIIEVVVTDRFHCTTHEGYKDPGQNTSISFRVTSLTLEHHTVFYDIKKCGYMGNMDSLTLMIWLQQHTVQQSCHDDVIKWNHFPRYWPFVRGIHQSPVNSPHKGQWSGALMFALIWTRINGWVNNGEAGDWRRHRAHYDVTVMLCVCFIIRTV